MTDQDLSQVNDTEIPAAKEILPLAPAINILSPNCMWELRGYDYEGLIWNDDPAKKPTKEAVIAKARELKEQAPWNRLRKERDARMREVDWVSLRSFRTGEPIPQEWKDYMQALADITETSKPIMIGGELQGVEWPARPDGKPTGYFRG